MATYYIHNIHFLKIKIKIPPGGKSLQQVKKKKNKLGLSRAELSQAGVKLGNF